MSQTRASSASPSPECAPSGPAPVAIPAPRRPGTARVLVVIPALNESATIASIVTRARAVAGCDALVVDDGSTDDTAATARGAGAVVVSLPYNLGVGGAVRTGFRYAAEHGYDTVVQLDADGQHDPADIPALVAALAHADVVVGARFAGEGSYEVHGPRRWAMTVLARVLSGRAGNPLTDVTSGFRATGRRGVRLFAAHYPADYLSDTTESLMIALRAGLTVDQVPVSMAVRAGGVPSQGPLRSVVHLARTSLSIGLAFVRHWPTSAEVQQEA